uniref:hypothetical protein n=1 Tax=Endozoicomonas sp. ONNA2 TaxID=2828741 RepID=UPI0021476FF4
SNAKHLAEYTRRVTVVDLVNKGEPETLCRNPLYDLLVDYLRAEDHETVPAALMNSWVLHHETDPDKNECWSDIPIAWPTVI